MNIEMLFNEDLLDDKDYDFFHYDCSYDLAKCKYGTWKVVSRGDIKGAYVDKDRNIYEEGYSEIVNFYVKNNAEYEKAVDEGKLIFDMNNWFTIEFYDNNGNYVDDYFNDSVYGCLSECYEDFKYQVENNLDDIINSLKEEGVIND